MPTTTPQHHQVPDSANALVERLTGLTGAERADARRRAIEAWLPMARLLAKRYAGRGEPADDLTQTAVVGLIKAIDRFDPGRGIDFAGFAVPTVLGEIRRHFRDRTWSVRPPRRVQELRPDITRARDELTQRLGRSPTVAEVAAFLGRTEEEVLEGLEGMSAYSAASLSTPIGADGTELGQLIGEEDHDLALAELRIALGPALAALDDRTRTILSLRFFGNLTQTEIGDRLGISQMHVSRLIKRGLAALRTELNAG